MIGHGTQDCYLEFKSLKWKEMCTGVTRGSCSKITFPQLKNSKTKGKFTISILKWYHTWSYYLGSEYEILKNGKEKRFVNLY